MTTQSVGVAVLQQAITAETDCKIFNNQTGKPFTLTELKLLNDPVAEKLLKAPGGNKPRKGTCPTTYSAALERLEMAIRARRAASAFRRTRRRRRLHHARAAPAATSPVGSSSRSSIVLGSTGHRPTRPGPSSSRRNTQPSSASSSMGKDLDAEVVRQSFEPYNAKRSRSSRTRASPSSCGRSSARWTSTSTRGSWARASWSPGKSAPGVT